MKKQKNDTTIKLEDLGVNPNEPGMPLIDMDNMPVLALRGSPVFSGMLIPVGLARESSLQLVDEAEKNNEVIALVAQHDDRHRLCTIGMVGRPDAHQGQDSPQRQQPGQQHHAHRAPQPPG